MPSTCSESKLKYRQLKRKFKFLVYENECYQEELRNLQRKLLKLSRDKNFLLDRLLQYEKVDESSEDSEATEISEDECGSSKASAGVAKSPRKRQARLDSKQTSPSGATIESASQPSSKRPRMNNKQQLKLTRPNYKSTENNSSFVSSSSQILSPSKEGCGRANSVPFVSINHNQSNQQYPPIDHQYHFTYSINSIVGEKDVNMQQDYVQMSANSSTSVSIPNFDSSSYLERGGSLNDRKNALPEMNGDGGFAQLLGSSQNSTTQWLTASDSLNGVPSL